MQGFRGLELRVLQDKYIGLGPREKGLYRGMRFRALRVSRFRGSIPYLYMSIPSYVYVCIYIYVIGRVYRFVQGYGGASTYAYKSVFTLYIYMYRCSVPEPCGGYLISGYVCFLTLNPWTP